MQDFKMLIGEEAARHKPRSDYSTWKQEELILNLTVLRAVGRECVTKIIDRAGVDWKETFRRAFRMADNPNPIVLEELYSICNDERPLRFLVWLRLELGYISLELMTRLIKLRVGREMIQIAGNKAAPLEVINSLLAVLNINKITSYHPEEESSEDLKQFGLERALTYQKEIGKEALEKSGFHRLQVLSALPPQNLGFPLEDKEPWNWLNPRLLALQINKAEELLSPLFWMPARTRLPHHGYIPWWC